MSTRKPTNPSNPRIKLPDADDEPSITQIRNTDKYEETFPVEDSGSHSGITHTPAAPEVSQGPWRERAFRPRGAMPRDQVISELERALAGAKTSAELKDEWLPLLRQAVEQAGGDGLDGVLSSMLGKPRPAKDPLVGDLVSQMAKVTNAKGPGDLIAESKKALDVVRAALASPAPRQISLKWLEKELEGKIEVDALLWILFAADEDLTRRLESVNKTLEQLREQFKAMPGTHPDGMFANFARLKVEKRVIEAEQKRRGARR